MDLEAKTIGSQSLEFFCNSTAQNPNDEASADTLVGALGLYNASVVGLNNYCSVALKASSWLTVQLQLLFLLRSTRKG